MLPSVWFRSVSARC